jgi:hypothetical protein
MSGAIGDRASVEIAYQITVETPPRQTCPRDGAGPDLDFAGRRCQGEAARRDPNR